MMVTASTTQSTKKTGRDTMPYTNALPGVSPTRRAAAASGRGASTAASTAQAAKASAANIQPTKPRTSGP